MSLDVYEACIHGFEDRVYDDQIIGIQNGYWAGYWSNPNIKSPKPVTTILQRIEAKVKSAQDKGHHHVDTIDVEAEKAKQRHIIEVYNSQHPDKPLPMI